MFDSGEVIKAWRELRPLFQDEDPTYDLVYCREARAGDSWAHLISRNRLGFLILVSFYSGTLTAVW